MSILPILVPGEDGIGPRHLQLLGLLVRKRAAISVSEVAREADLSLARTSRVLNDLAIRKLALRDYSPTDLRVIRFAPTEAGRQLHAIVQRRTAEDARRHLTPTEDHQP